MFGSEVNKGTLMNVGRSNDTDCFFKLKIFKPLNKTYYILHRVSDWDTT